VAFRTFGVTFEVASDVVNVEAEEVAEAVRLEDATGEVGGHHIVDVTLQEAT
jgi:hypothetical protein